MVFLQKRLPKYYDADSILTIPEESASTEVVTAEGDITMLSDTGIESNKRDSENLVVTSVETSGSTIPQKKPFLQKKF